MDGLLTPCWSWGVSQGQGSAYVCRMPHCAAPTWLRVLPHTALGALGRAAGVLASRAAVAKPARTYVYEYSHTHARRRASLPGPSRAQRVSLGFDDGPTREDPCGRPEPSIPGSGGIQRDGSEHTGRRISAQRAGSVREAAAEALLAHHAAAGDVGQRVPARGGDQAGHQAEHHHGLQLRLRVPLGTGWRARRDEVWGRDSGV